MSNSAERSPLFDAQNAPRYERQQMIRDYQRAYDCRLVVMSDVIFSRSIPLLEEALYDASPEEDLHILLSTPGGDGETAFRLIRQAQSRCKELTVIVPDQETNRRCPTLSLSTPAPTGIVFYSSSQNFSMPQSAISRLERSLARPRNPRLDLGG